jgi:hypothetical protein
MLNYYYYYYYYYYFHYYAQLESRLHVVLPVQITLLGSYFRIFSRFPTHNFFFYGFYRIAFPIVTR